MKTKICSKCNIEKGIVGFYKDKNKADGYGPSCKQCKKESRNLKKNRESYYRNKEYYQEYRKKSQTFVKLCKQELGCFFCKDKDDICLDFHHVGNKKYDITKVNSIDAIIKEMCKCMCVCCKCHRKIHAGVLSVPQNWQIKMSVLLAMKAKLS